MEQTSNQSTVTQLMEQIETEIKAMQQAMNGFATVARHDIISYRFTNLDTCFRALATHVGEQTALEAITQELEEQL